MIKCIPAVYSVLFNVKMVVGILEGDINHGAKELTRALAEMGDEAATLQSIMTAVIRDKGGVEGVRTSKEPTTCKSILWLNRATTFITMFIRGIHDGKESKVASSTAYDTILKPYHGFMTKKVVGTAMGLCPSADVIRTKFNLPDEAAAAEQMGAFLALMEPLTAAVLALIEKNGLNFDDKV